MGLQAELYSPAPLSLPASLHLLLQTFLCISGSVLEGCKVSIKNGHTKDLLLLGKTQL